MRILKRFSALLCVLVLLLNLALFPFRARATGYLMAASAGVVVTAALMATGIYPYEQQTQFSEYVSSNLSALWNQYIEWRQSNIGNVPETGAELSSLTGYITSNTVVIGKKVWATLSDFTTWIRGHFSLTDNQTGVNLGTVGLRIGELPTIAAAEWGAILADGVLLGRYWLNSSRYTDGTIGALSSGFFLVGTRIEDNPNYYRYMVYTTNSDYLNQVYKYTNAWGVEVFNDFPWNVQWKGQSVRKGQLSTSANWQPISGVNIPLFDTEYDALTAIFGSVGKLNGFTADTGSIKSLPALDADKDWGGLRVQGAANPATTIEQGVTARQQPLVTPVEVTVAGGTEVDAETGEISEDVVAITPEDVVPTVAALSPPASFLSALQTTMTTKFPFCLPFDLARILTAFYVAPQAPVISLTFHDPFTDSDYSITVDLSPWDNVAAVVRNFEAMILLAGFCLNFDKFNIIHLILGGLG